MNIWENKYILENMSKVGSTFLIAFLIAFFLTPLVAKLAKYIKAVDLPGNMRKRSDTTSIRRIHKVAMPKIGGVAMIISIILTLFITDNLINLPKGVILGGIVLFIAAIADDIVNIKGSYMMIIQIVSAGLVVLSNISITSLNVFGERFNFNWFSAAVQIGQYTHNIIFPGDLITIIWIVGMINVVNWIDGIDGLLASITATTGITMALFALSNGNIALAVLISIFVGGVVGVFPFNYNPAKIFYGSSGSMMMGFFLAIFAIFSSTRWTTTLIVLGLPIIDGIIVLAIRFKEHPEVRKNPLKLLTISDKNHIHHRLLAAGYSQKTIVLIAMSIVLILSSIALYFSNLRTDLVAFIVGFAFLFASFSLIFFLKKRNEKTVRMKLIASAEKDGPKGEAVVKVVFEGKEEDEEKKFIY